jgi:hypothetical protein
MNERNTHSRGLKILTVLLAAAVISSAVHYTDNYLAFEKYPQGDIEISDDTVWIAWIAFTAFGLAGYLLYRRGRTIAVATCLAIYSVSGLISIGHYTAPGMSELAAWRHVSIAIDGILGAAILAFAYWSVREERREIQLRSTGA